MRFKFRRKVPFILEAYKYFAGKRVFVPGAGLGGLSFAVNLHRICREHGLSPPPEVHLFERDDSAEARAGQGYSLSVRAEGVQVHSVIQMSLMAYVANDQQSSFL